MNALDVGDGMLVRLVFFASLFFLFIALEQIWPRRMVVQSRVSRWVGNLSLSATNSICLRLVFPFSGTAFALAIEEVRSGYPGLYDLPVVLSVVIFVVVFDLTIYFQHRFFHAIAWLWRLHRVHHTDLGYDVTTGLRFHPVSIVLSMAIKLMLVLLVGADAIAILVAEILLNATSMFNHSNIRLPDKLDRVIRWVIVTPDMHRIHHSIQPEEHSSNFGFNFSCWDRIFGTYLETATLSQSELQIGIEGYEGKSVVRVDRLLLQPFALPKES